MAVSLIFITVRFWDYRHLVRGRLTDPKLLLSTLLSSGIYALSGFLLSFGWWLILGSHTRLGEGLKWNSAWRIYGKTQIAKYIPGNIFHFAGRHVLAAKEGASHKQLVMAATCEIVMMLVTTGLISLTTIVFLWQRIPHYPHPIALVLAALSVGFVVLIIGLRRFGFRQVIQGVQWRKLMAAQLSYFCFFAISVSLFLFLFFQEGIAVTNWVLIAGGYALAWAIGFVVPGAPGGLGVREAMLVTFLSGVLEEKSVLITAILFRFVTTLGDVLFFLIAGGKSKS
jgi:uncharacterized membrane protein YbhN (UPF0104 family)